MKHRVTHAPKACLTCGATFHRRSNEHASNYARRRTCSRECSITAANRNRPPKPPPNDHDPCEICGGPVKRRAGEKTHRFRARRTCSNDCRRTLLSRTRRRLGLGGSRPRTRQSPDERKAREAARKRAARTRAKQLAPTGYHWNGRFPTPEGIKPTWVTITGPELPPVQPKRQAGPGVSLTDTLEAHPDLAIALAGELTDSWFPYSRSSSVKGASTDA